MNEEILVLYIHSKKWAHSLSIPDKGAGGYHDGQGRGSPSLPHEVYILVSVLNQETFREHSIYR